VNHVFKLPLLECVNFTEKHNASRINKGGCESHMYFPPSKCVSFTEKPNAGKASGVGYESHSFHIFCYTFAIQYRHLSLSLSVIIPCLTIAINLPGSYITLLDSFIQERPSTAVPNNKPQVLTNCIFKSMSKPEKLSITMSFVINGRLEVLRLQNRNSVLRLASGGKTRANILSSMLKPFSVLGILSCSLPAD
jgi:hypothetical protein